MLLLLGVALVLDPRLVSGESTFDEEDEGQEEGEPPRPLTP